MASTASATTNLIAVKETEAAQTRKTCGRNDVTFSLEKKAEGKEVGGGLRKDHNRGYGVSIL